MSRRSFRWSSYELKETVEFPITIEGQLEIVVTLRIILDIYSRQGDMWYIRHLWRLIWDLNPLLRIVDLDYDNRAWTLPYVTFEMVIMSWDCNYATNYGML